MNVNNIGVEKYSVSQLFDQDESFVYEVPKHQRTMPLCMKIAHPIIC